MPISYAERKRRRQARLLGLIPELGQHMALRHVEAAAKLSLEAQQTLAKALTAGLRRIPDAIAYLQQHPQTPADEVLRVSKNGHLAKPVPPVPTDSLPLVPANHDPDALSELSELLQGCFPGMPGMTANALAADELFSGVLALVLARQACFRSTSIQSELVFVVLCGLVLHFINELNQLMTSRPHYRGALLQSGLGWPFDEQPVIFGQGKPRLGL